MINEAQKTALLKKFNGSQYALAKASGLSFNTVKSFLLNKGTPDLETVDALCKAAGMTKVDFFALEEKVTQR